MCDDMAIKEAAEKAASKAAAVFKECLQCGGDPEALKFNNASECVLWRGVLIACITGGMAYSQAASVADCAVLDYRKRAKSAKDTWGYDKRM